MQTPLSNFSPSRRRFLRGDPAARRETLLPPWNIGPDLFHARCTGCGDCIMACPEHILERGSEGFPRINFSKGGCTFCGECVTSCQTQALRREPEHAPWAQTVAFGESCLAARQVVCRTCGERCETGAIRFRLTTGGIPQPQLDKALCTGCGFCLADCPTAALRIVPAEAA